MENQLGKRKACCNLDPQEIIDKKTSLSDLSLVEKIKQLISDGELKQAIKILKNCLKHKSKIRDFLGRQCGFYLPPKLTIKFC